MRGILLGLTGWAGSTIEVEISGIYGSTPDTYTVPDSLDTATVWEVVTALTAWINDAGRPWGAGAEFAATWYEWAYDPGAPTHEGYQPVGGQSGVTCEVGYFYSLVGLTPSGAAATYLPPRDVGGTDGERRIFGSPAVDVDTYGWSRWDKSKGCTSARGVSWIAGNTRFAPRRPVVRFVLTPEQAYTWEQGLRHLPQANPWVDVYHVAAGAWRRVVVGNHSLDPRDAFDLVTVDLEVIGEGDG